MSTHQPPGGQQPEGMPGYAQPQDPWAGGPEQDLASAPTDPMPQQGEYHHGDLWSQPTVPHDGQYGFVPPPQIPQPPVPQPPVPQPPVPQPQKSRNGVTLAVVAVVLVLGVAGGYAAWYVTKSRAVATPAATPTATSTATAAVTSATAVSTSTEPVAFDPHRVKVGDCLINKGTEVDPDMRLTPCTTPKSFKVIKVSAGAEIPEGPSGKFNKEITSVAECRGTGFQSWYGYQDANDDALDLFLCLTNNP